MLLHIACVCIKECFLDAHAIICQINARYCIQGHKWAYVTFNVVLEFQIVFEKNVIAFVVVNVVAFL